MEKTLVIVESPAKAKTIEKFLGKRYTVKASMGHVRDLPKSQFGVDVDNDFNPKYITIRGKGDILKELRDSARKAGRIYLATDPDREGEAIAWHLAHVLGLPEDESLRISFNEITKDAVQKAIKHPRPIDDSLVDAQQARRVLDRVVGYKLSPLLWRKVRRGLSAGRVQSVAVRLIVDREDDVQAFVPEEYWTVSASMHLGEEQAFDARYYGAGGEKRELHGQAEVEALLASLKGAAYQVESVKKRERRRNPALPFTTSSLQQEAARKLGFTARRTMSIAQQLYEGLELGPEGHVGLVSYIRTDSTRVSEEARTEAAAYITATFDQDHVNQEGPKEEKPGRLVQGAHECIRPSSIHRQPDQVKKWLSNDQFKLYRLVWERFLASQMAPAVLDTVSVDIAASAGKGKQKATVATFRATGSTIKFAGFMAVYIEGQDEAEGEKDESFLPEVNEGDALKLDKLDPRQHFTQPPARYTEAMLVRTLEEKGIGRPSTYAPIIETILARGYVVREEKRFMPTDLGRIVVDMLKQYFPQVIDVEFTASMEQRLDSVEEGDTPWKQVIREFYGPFAKTLSAAEEAIGPLEIPEEVSDVPCDKCGRMMVVKHGRYGKFLACPGFPECRNTKPFLESTGVPCPKCGGEIVERKSKKGRKFYGCANYPACDFVVWQRPVPKNCPDCGSFLVQKRSKELGPHLACSNETCSYTEALEEAEAAPV
ncbi:MAG: type I DNA topoisomerase [Symbiobacteriia bacterium]